MKKRDKGNGMSHIRGYFKLFSEKYRQKFCYQYYFYYFWALDFRTTLKTHIKI